VPVLIGGAALAILLQRPPRELAAAGRRGRRGRDPWWLVAGTAVVAVYGGYFGAAAGVLLLALLLLGTGEGLPRSNALKNVVLGAANAVAAVGFVVLAPVAWSAALPLALGCLAGGRLGPRVVRRVDQTLLRTLIALAGLGLAVVLAVDAYG
ncbi:MAG TPA: TSUP family transporter, partial [Geodermatophilus sp.]|nr:TSUP family transporter [Geodermatophilus sp.]